MNNLTNTVSMIGRLGANPEIISTNKDLLLARFRLAVNTSFKDKDGIWNTQTQWHTIKAWGKTAELVQQNLQKGQKIMIEGRLVNQSYEKDGEKKLFTDISINNFLILSPKIN